MSFLTQGKWNNPALVLGFDPVEVVRRAVVNGKLLKAASAPVSAPVSVSARDVTRGGRGIKYPTEAERVAALRLAKDTFRAKNLAAGLTAKGKPRRKLGRPRRASSLPGRAAP